MISPRSFLNSLIALISSIALASCVNISGTKSVGVTQPTEVKGSIESAQSDASTPITVKLILSTAPRVNEKAELMFIISSPRDAPNTKATITLPDGTDLIIGELEWVGDLRANEPQTMKATIMFTTEGNKTLEAKALCDLGNGDIWGDIAYIYLNTTREAGHSGFSPQQPTISTGAEQNPPAITPNP